MQDINARGIAIVETGIYFQPTAGSVRDITLKSLGGIQIELAVDM